MAAVGTIAMAISLCAIGFFFGQAAELDRLAAAQDLIAKKDTEIEILNLKLRVEEAKNNNFQLTDWHNNCEERYAVSYLLGQLAFVEQAGLNKIFGDNIVSFTNSIIYFKDDNRNIRFVADDTNVCGLWGLDSLLFTVDNGGEEGL